MVNDFTNKAIAEMAKATKTVSGLLPGYCCRCS